jgi:peptidyl-dipeptidase A
MRKILLSAASLAALGLVACQAKTVEPTQATNATTDAPAAAIETVSVTETNSETKAPTIQEAKEFLERAEREIVALRAYGGKVYWIQANFITDDTNALAAMAGAQGARLSTRLANQAKRFNDLSLPADMRRKMDGLKRGSNFPAPEKEGAAETLARLMTGLEAAYGTGKFEHQGKTLNLGQASDIIASSRDPEELQAIWEGWRTISPRMKSDYAKMVKIVNEGSRELGYEDTGALWRGGYDMDGEAFIKEADRLWGQVKPLYDQLHCNTRAALNETYGDDIQPADAPIRADLLGNMWGQSWGNIYDMVAPKGGGKGVDVTALLVENGYDQKKMVEVAETFFTSLGFEPLPQTFWERSLITKPKDREVVCHASAWNLDDMDDIRIKMCTKINGEDFVTVHHELGHNFYQRAYKDQPVFYKDGANDGFHEAIGDMIALSITPEYLVKIGLLDEEDVPGADADLALLMRQAMDKVAFLPFGLMVDQWRWKVFSGEYSPSEYNSGWWELREKYQGLRHPGETRPSDAFDPGAKFHIPGNTPYMRYFLAHILQFQFHKAACDMAGFEGPLHQCSIYDNKEVGQRFNAMMEMGASKPWPDALEAFTGTRDMDGSAILEYFAPLMTYLEEQNKDRTCGWDKSSQ